MLEVEATVIDVSRDDIKVGTKKRSRSPGVRPRRLT
jgi:hypothetical protein